MYGINGRAGVERIQMYVCTYVCMINVYMYMCSMCRERVLGVKSNSAGESRCVRRSLCSRRCKIKGEAGQGRKSQVELTMATKL